MRISPSRCVRLLVFLLAAALSVPALVVVAATQAHAAATAPLNVVVRVGDGTAALSNVSTAVFLDEYAPDGTRVRSTPLPTAAAGNNRPLTMSGSATSEGALAQSSDGRYLTLAGGTAPGLTSVASTSASTTPRVIARGDAGGAIDTTPFKRPENGQFRPGSDFREFFFDETGDTNALSAANVDLGGWGSVLKLIQDRPTADTGKLSLFYKGAQAHTGFDNLAFTDAGQLAVVEDAGGLLRTQRNALDSGFLFDVTQSYAAGRQPLRFLAEGRDPPATLDSGFSGMPGFQNDGDNEITGLHVSDGDAGIGANPTWEIIPALR